MEKQPEQRPVCRSPIRAFPCPGSTQFKQAAEALGVSATAVSDGSNCWSRCWSALVGNAAQGVSDADGVLIYATP